MIVLGIILIVVGIVAKISILTTIGVILLIAIFFVFERRPGRKDEGAD